MTTEHPITPPPELVQQWAQEHFETTPLTDASSVRKAIATQAARWGADMELEACCEWLREWDSLAPFCSSLRTARRPKPPSLKEQALQCLKNIDDACESEGFSRADDTEIIRRALESLPS